MAKGVPSRFKGKGLKGPEMRKQRTLSLSDSAWSALDETAEILGCSRSDLVQWWSEVLAESAVQIEAVAKNERVPTESVSDRTWEHIPPMLKQLLAARFGSIQSKDLIIAPNLERDS